MFVIAFPQHTICGGLGDRLVGLISVATIANLLQRPFYIIWDKEDITPYFNYEKYNYRLLKDKPKSNQCRIFNSIDNQKKYKSDLMSKDVSKMFDSLVNICMNNQEISQYVYCNPLYKEKKGDYLKDIMGNYQKLFTEILVPTKLIKDKIQSICGTHKTIIGIQFRCGDMFMKTNPYERHKTGLADTLKDKLQKIKLLVRGVKGYKIFITSDHPHAYTFCCQVFGRENVLYNSDMIQHLDRKTVQKDFSKTFVDCLILAQKTQYLFITECSNFGRIAALTCSHDVIFNENGDKLEKKKLLSKHERLFV